MISPGLKIEGHGLNLFLLDFQDPTSHQGKILQEVTSSLPCQFYCAADRSVHALSD